MSMAATTDKIGTADALKRMSMRSILVVAVRTGCLHAICLPHNGERIYAEYNKDDGCCYSHDGISEGGDKDVFAFRDDVSIADMVKAIELIHSSMVMLVDAVASTGRFFPKNADGSCYRIAVAIMHDHACITCLDGEMTQAIADAVKQSLTVEKAEVQYPCSAGKNSCKILF